MSSVFGNFPALKPPPGVSSNFTNPDSLATATIIPCAITTALMTVFVALRLYCRVWTRKAAGADDIACVLAFAGSIGYMAVTLSTLNEGIGNHQWDVRVVQFTDGFLKKLLVFQIGYPPTIFFAKLSLFLLYFRLFGPNLWVRYLIYFGIGFTGLFYTASTLVEAISCSPSNGQTWLAAMMSSRCGNDRILGYVMSVVNVISDFYLLVLPIPVIWKLQLPMRKKIGVIAVFMIGLTACFCSVLNAYYRVKLEQTDDVTWNVIPVSITSIVEINVGIIVGCMPVLTSQIRSLFSSLSSLNSLSVGYIKSRLLRSKKRSSSASDGFDRMQETPPQHNEIFLESQLLGSVQGKGKFLQSAEFPQRDWMRKSVMPEPGIPTTREEFEHD